MFDTSNAQAADIAADKLLTIREMGEVYGVTARTLRFYEQRGLLAPIRRGQSRHYTRRDRARLTLILQGKRFGFSLDQLSDLLALYDPASDNRAQTEAILAVARERLADMRSQHAALTEAIAELQNRIDTSTAALAR